jgi:uncharacterized OB-fold protein
MTKSLTNEYLGMPVRIGELDHENREFYRYCASHDLHLQRCDDCDLIRYPATTACPFCSSPRATWTAVEARGSLYSYGEVHHAIQGVFRQHTPYLLLLVELDTQRGQPGEHDGIRMTSNLAMPDGELAPPEIVKKVGIGTRLKIVYKDVSDEVSIPLFTIDEDAEQPHHPWRYPEVS